MKKCPLLKMKDCQGEKCMWWTKLLMKDISSQNVKEEGNCAIVWLPDILREQNKNVIGVAAAVESRGNESVEAHKVTNKIFAGMAKLALHGAIEEKNLKEIEGA